MIHIMDMDIMEIVQIKLVPSMVVDIKGIYVAAYWIV